MNHGTALLLADAGGVLLAMAIGFRTYIFRLAEWLRTRQFTRRCSGGWPSPPVLNHLAAAAPKEEDGMDKVQQLLARATGGAEAYAEFGMDHDEHELVTNFIASMDTLRSSFEALAQAQADAGALAPDKVAECTDRSMQISPGYANVLFLWRLARTISKMGTADLVEAAVEVVHYHTVWDQHAQRPDYRSDVGIAHLNRFEAAMRKLASTLPREG